MGPLFCSFVQHHQINLDYGRPKHTRNARTSSKTITSTSRTSKTYENFFEVEETPMAFSLIFLTEAPLGFYQEQSVENVFGLEKAFFYSKGFSFVFLTTMRFFQKELGFSMFRVMVKAVFESYGYLFGYFSAL